MVVFSPWPRGPKQRMGVCLRQLEQSTERAWEASQLDTKSEAQERPFDAEAGDRRSGRSLQNNTQLKTSSQASSCRAAVGLHGFSG